MHSVEPNTMAYHLGRPALSKLDFSTVTVPTVVSKFGTCKGLLVPDSEVIRFYLHNHAFAKVISKVGSGGLVGPYEKLINKYLGIVSKQTQRVFFYLLAICTRESRHVRNGKFVDLFEDMFGYEITNFHKKIHHTPSAAAIKMLKKEPPQVFLPEYTAFLFEVFDKGSYSEGYGGKAWAAVAEVLNKFAMGEISGEMLLDLSYALAHNNGPIFNKGIWYDQYTTEFITLLDVQRSGQIPQLIQDASNGIHYLKMIDAEHIVEWDQLAKQLNGEFYNSINWLQVQEAGALSNVSHKISQQDNTSNNGTPAANYEVMPGLNVPIITRKSQTTKWSK